MNARSTFFHYKTGKSLLHKIPSVPKILLLLFFSVASFYVPPIAASILYAILILLCFFYLKFSVREIFSDAKPAIFYCVFLYIVEIVSNAILLYKTDFENAERAKSITQILKIFVPSIDFFSMSIHLALSLLVSSMFFRTTKITQFTEGFAQIEHFFTRKDKTPVAQILSLTITFIPRIATFWERLNFAWKARGGKENISKIKKLTPSLFKESMNEAYQKSLARMNRE